jgi:Protein of unknown function (DUF1549)/Protein of unknown function (DUF1553)
MPQIQFPPHFAETMAASASIFGTQHEDKAVSRTDRWDRSVISCTILVPGLILCVLLVLCTGAARAASTESGLEVVPAYIVLEGKTARQQLAVTLRQLDGSLRDVTASCRYVVEPESIAAVTSAGIVFPRADGLATVRAIFQNETAEVELRVARADWAREPGLRTDIVPLLSKAGCNMGACHGNLSAKGGFRLSLRGEDPNFDYLALTHELSGRRVNLLAPDQSLVLQKPTAVIGHEGGLRFRRESTEAETLLAWITAGARFDGASSPRIKALRVFPAERILAPGSAQQQLVVTAEFADGITRDVTRQAAYDVSDPTRAEVSVDGCVHVGRPCETTIAVRFMTGRGTSRLAFLADRPGFVWSSPAPKGPIDALVFAKLEALRINPSLVCNDSTFQRRAFLDAIGRLPDPEEAREFLYSSDPEKRTKLIDRLVDRPEFADFWALKWADLLRNEEKTMGEKGAWVFQRWLRDELARDAPLDALVRQIVASLGSTWQNPPSSFHRTNRDPMTAAESVGQVFLGVRLQCARCHNHPFDVWTQDDYYGLAAFFANITRKQPSNVRSDRLDLHEINGDEYIYLSGPPQIVQPRTGAILNPKTLSGMAADRSDGSRGTTLEHLADWLTRQNHQFSRNLANRVWFHLLGRGIVEPVDDFRDSNPPSNPALLDLVTTQFEAGGLRLKPLVAWIMKSSIYQLSATPTATNAEDEANFSHAAVRLLPAEVLLDAISQVLDVPEQFRHAPATLHAAQLPGASGGVAFLKTFGKPDRLLTCECERSESTTLAQAFQMINGETVRKKLELGANRIGHELDAGRQDTQILDEVYLAAVARQPTASERLAMTTHLKRSGDKRKALEDVVWALLNSKEFLLRH